MAIDLVNLLNNVSYANKLGLYSLLSLIILIIIYLRRPKPIKQVMPTLRFFAKEKGKTQHFRIFRHLMRNLLFFLQFIAIALLAFGVASPFILKERTSQSANTVLVIDASASSQAVIDGKTRFQMEIEEANNRIDGVVSIILAAHVPIVVAKHVGKSEASSILSTLKPFGTTSNIGDAMVLAGTILGNEDGKVIVISDFASTHGPDPFVAMRKLNSEKVAVEMVPISKPANNIAITNIELDAKKTKVYVTSFASENKEVDLSVNKGSQSLHADHFEISPESTEVIEFDTPDGESKVTISPQDALDIDNTAYLSAPIKKKTKIFYITNWDNIRDNKKTPVLAALRSFPDVDIEVAAFPLVKDISHDLIVIDQITNKDIAVGDFERKILPKVEGGAGLIIIAQEDLGDIRMAGLLPITIGGIANSSSVQLEMVNSMTKDVDLSSTRRYLSASRINGTSVLASAAEDASPIVALNENVGSGKVMYYGLFDEYSDFKLSTTYPIFWSNVVGYMIKAEDIRTYNLDFGSAFGASQLEPGIYGSEDKRVSVNLVSEKESNLNPVENTIEEDKLSFYTKEITRKDELRFDKYIIFIVLFIILVEMFVAKWRGEI